MEATNIQIQYMREPLGIDTKYPIISWNLTDGKTQGAYQIRAVGDLGTKYDSGIVEDEHMWFKIPVGFLSRERVDVSVRIWDKEELRKTESTDEEVKMAEAAHSWFEMGLHEKDWRAKWIDPELVTPKENRMRPASYLRKTFSAAECERARLYVTCHGIYNVYLNGKHVDGFVMAPGTSEYDKLLQYQTYDVSDYLKKGENELFVVLGNGWWRGTVTYDGIRNGFGIDTALLLQLETDRKTVCVSDETWMASQDGPLRDTDNMNGEVYDAGREDIFFKKETDSRFHAVQVKEYGYENLCCSNCPPPTEHETFHPVLIQTPAGEQVLDFGQNIAGYIGFEIEAEKGQQISFIHGEVLDQDGNFQIENYQSQNYDFKQEIRYICKQGKNRYKASNTFMGFRYVKVEGMREIHPEDFTAYAVYTDLEQTAQFSCGHPFVNQLFENALWSLKGNLLDIPTDCPTREKSGFTGDLVTYIHTMQYLMNAYPMIDKFIRNQAASQAENGCVKQIVADPRPYGPIDGSAGWSDSFEILPEVVRERYYCDVLFETYYEQIKKWTDFCIRRAAFGTREENQDNPYAEYLEDQAFHWGEWLEPGMDFPRYMENIQKNGEPEVGTAYLSYCCQVLSEYARKTNRKKDAGYYGEVAEKARLAYRYAFTKNGRIHSERMCRYIRPIVLNLLDEAEKKQAASDLNQIVIQNQYRLNTGFLTSHELCRVLSEYGYQETAYRLLLNEEMPGWLYSVKQGATTIPEAWDAYGKNGERKGSFNHYSYGAIVGWLMDSVAGIRLYNGKITIAPKISKEIGYVKARYQSPMGEIVSEWECRDEKISYHILIPCGCSAEFIAEDGGIRQFESGEYTFTV